LLDVEFDEIVGSSKFSEKGKKVAKKLLKKNLAFKADNGAVIAKLEEDNLPDKVILRSDGTALYSTQDLGSAIDRHKKHKFDKMIYVVGSEQKLYFQQIFKIFEKLGKKWSDRLIHIPFGLLNLEGGKISSRKGKVVFLKDVIEEAKKRALKEIKKKSPKLKKKKKVAEKVGIAALKYSILSKEPVKNIEFSFDQISFEGDTGPYLQYSFARASSILKKARKKGKYNKEKILEFDKSELSLIRKMSLFLSTIKNSRKQLNPSILANYTYNLCKSFNEFYHKCKVLKSEKEKFRLKLVESFKQVLGNCLDLLGIEKVEEM
jgi:arginyl-tRNA synthetase